MPKTKESKQKSVQSRPPIVVILGHVDHGKTTLLDAIRKTSVQAGEAGGITQAIGASVVTTKEGKKITFIDTPGHAAFSNMRSHGTEVADIAVLVVAADDGVKPQTKEALEYILQADIPFIVAVSKIDLPSASVEKVRSQLEKEQILFEGKGGDTPLVTLSAKTGEGVSDLLEMILLVSELNEIQGNSQANLEAVVIETKKDKSGPIASVVVRNGTLQEKSELVGKTTEAKVKALFDFQGKKVATVGPGMPAQILGFGKLPEVGEQVWQRGANSLPAKSSQKPLLVKKEDDAEKGIEGKLTIIVKAANSGSLEAIIKNLPKEVTVVDSSIGTISESDVFMAKSANANIYAFELKPKSSISKLAEAEGVKIYNFDIIYKLFEKLEEELKKGEEVILGKAEIVASFPYDNKQVAGCKVKEGRIAKSDELVLVRNNNELGKVKITSLKREKQDIDVAKAGEECGILFTPQLEFRPKDMLLSRR